MCTAWVAAWQPRIRETAYSMCIGAVFLLLASDSIVYVYRISPSRYLSFDNSANSVVSRAPPPRGTTASGYACSAAARARAGRARPPRAAARGIAGALISYSLYTSDISIRKRT